MRDDNKIKSAILVSLLLHFLLMLLLPRLAHLDQVLLVPENEPAMEEQNNQAPLVFDLVETPESARSETPAADTRHLSDKTARAQDQNRSESLPEGDPYSKGRTDRALFRGNPERSMPRMNPDRQPRTSESESRERPTTSEDRLLVARRQESNQPKTFHPNVLRGQQSPQKSLPSNYTDDVNRDQTQTSSENVGQVSLNTYQWDFAPYILAMKKKLRRNMYPPPALYRLGIGGEAVVRFRVYPDGQIENLQVLSFRGHSAFSTTSVNAIKASLPFEPLPEDFPEKYLELTWTFLYSIL